MESVKCSPQVRVDVALRGRRHRRNTTSNELKVRPCYPCIRAYLYQRQNWHLYQHRRSDPPLVRRARRRKEKWTHRRVSLLLAARHFDGFTNFAAIKVEGDASPKAMSQADLPRTSRKRKADAQTRESAIICHVKCWLYFFRSGESSSSRRSPGEGCIPSRFATNRKETKIGPVNT